MIDISHINLEVQIKYIRTTLDEIKSYARVQQGAIAKGGNITLNDYLKNYSNYSGTNILVIADLSNMIIGEDNMIIGDNSEPSDVKHELLDLRGADFSNAKLDNSTFIYCRLDFASFNNARLYNTRFEQGNILNGVDFRGTSLSHCFFSDVSESNMPIGIRLSTTFAIAAFYSELDKSEREYKVDLINQIIDKTYEVDKAYSNLPWFSRWRADQASLDKYYSLVKELEELKHMQSINGKLDQQEPIMHRSCQNIINNTTIFDPCYDRDSSFIEKDQRRTYVSLDRDDMIEFLELAKKISVLTINNFAKQKFIDSGQIARENTKYIADFSTKNSLREGAMTDLTGLVFENVNLSSANFAGVNFSGSKFINANISKSNFEFAGFYRLLVIEHSSSIVQFSNVNAQGANFRKIEGEEIEILNSDFRKTQLPYSEIAYAKVLGSNFDYSNIEHGKWRAIEIKECSFNFIHAESIELTGSLARCQFQHTILSNAYLKGIQVIDVDFTQAKLDNSEVSKARFKQTIFDHVDAANINLTDAELDNLTTLNNADLHNATLLRMRTEGVYMTGDNLNNPIEDNLG